MVVGADFPDEQYADFDEWAAAMASDDTDAPTSPLWHGGGQWLLYGLGLVLRCKIVITSMYKTTDLTLTLTLILSLTVALTPTLTLTLSLTLALTLHLTLTLTPTLTLTRYPDLVAGTGFVDGATHEVVLAGDADGRVVRLAMLHDDDGCPDHFDVLTEASPRASPSTSPRASPPPLPLMILADAVRPAQGGVAERMPSLSSQPSSDASGSESPHSSPPSSALRRLWEAPDTAESPAVPPPQGFRFNVKHRFSE